MQLIDAVDTAEQAQLRAAVRDLIRQHPDGSAWKRLTTEMGLIGLAVSEDAGGVGASLTEVAIVVGEVGRALLPVPYLPSALAAAVLPDDSPLLPSLVDGSITAALAPAADVEIRDGRLFGSARSVLDGGAAGVFLIGVGPDVLAVPAHAIERRPVDGLDQTRTLADLVLDGATGTPVRVSAERLEQFVQALLATESAAAAERALELTVDYLKTREQFGRVLGSFQALKHRCADLAVEVASATATARAAVQAAATSDAELAIIAPLAKRHCADVFVHVAGEMIQLHGGIGFTWEHDAHRYFKRAKTNQLLNGTSDELRRLVATRAGLV